MSRVLFAPFSITGGLLAGMVATKLFELLWKRVDDVEPPAPEHRRIEPWKLAVALLIEGAIFRVVRGGFDHAARAAFFRTTGRWPGEPRPEAD
jgi:hypothetical protein